MLRKESANEEGLHWSDHQSHLFPPLAGYSRKYHHPHRDYNQVVDEEEETISGDD
jgi:hypothetical protein